MCASEGREIQNGDYQKEETVRRTHIAVWMLVGIAAVMAGCASYYRVNDPAGTREYYTTTIDKTKAGAITFKDEKSGSVVTLQSSEVKEISEDEFNAAVKSQEKKGEDKKDK
jgi:hypothetical protein